MNKFRIVLVAMHSDVVNIGSKLLIDEVDADYIQETSTGYALMNNNGHIVYAVPAGLIVKKEETDKQ